jgi:hypothetical protein
LWIADCELIERWTLEVRRWTFCARQ